jgi:tetratricopeptide (TPR) repeat protein
MKRKLLAVFLLAVIGAALIPFETSLQAEQKAAGFRSTKLDLPLRQQIGQMGYLAALSGFRSPLAMYTFLEANEAWANTQWSKVQSLLEQTTTLQPRSRAYWDLAAWHMAWNASQAAMDDPKQPSEFLRKRAQHAYFDIGREFLEKGIENIPDDYYLYQKLGELYRQKYEDHCKAAEAYAKAAAFDKAPDYVKRFYGYELAQCPGHEKEAYEYLRKRYEMGDKERLPSLINYLKKLENDLDVPEAERIKSE